MNVFNQKVPYVNRMKCSSSFTVCTPSSSHQGGSLQETETKTQFNWPLSVISLNRNDDSCGE